MELGEVLMSDAVVMELELDCQSIMWNLIKSLAEIKQNCVSLLPSVCQCQFGGHVW